MSLKVWRAIDVYVSLKAKSTQGQYRAVLGQWYRFMKAKPNTMMGGIKIARAKKADATAFLQWMLKQKGEKSRVPGRTDRILERTVRQKFLSLRCVYAFLIEQEVVKSNPFDQKSILPREREQAKRPTKVVPYDKVREMLQKPPKNTREGIRDRFVLGVLFGAALRRTEVLNLRLGHIIAHEDGTMYIRVVLGKGQKDRKQPIPKWLESRAIDLTLVRESEGATLDDFLIMMYKSVEGERVVSDRVMNYNTLRRLFKRYCDLVGLDGALYSPHSARATAITRLLDQGASHRDVQDFSGHGSVRMVEWYDKRRTSVTNNPARDLDYDEN